MSGKWLRGNVFFFKKLFFLWCIFVAKISVLAENAVLGFVKICFGAVLNRVGLHELYGPNIERDHFVFSCAFRCVYDRIGSCLSYRFPRPLGFCGSVENERYLVSYTQHLRPSATAR